LVATGEGEVLFTDGRNQEPVGAGGRSEVRYWCHPEWSEGSVRTDSATAGRL